ncbi:right-handed parallel beta-helix repeat-containing protein [Mesorhizobium sp. L-8-3]|uniref:right-handed parallel beta-helix repeat-containing protein n=1 Tax=Mesorhizobium sp. L-8-3 TaxID=2744522 RepID=UPI001936056C|nr:right-handed parallel beta-helix repeat-containing protein [Mesorhizobium sp. L-8-3]BCH20829.1 hypothetical protein MesoLjLb_06140 [Mesorhizobium sp. L-8-3]
MASTPTGFPDATTTGVPSGTQLTVYTGPMTITEDGTVIDGKIINGTLRVLADNVVIKNSQVNFGGMWGVDAEGAKNITIQDSDFVGPGYSGDSNAAILGSGNFLRNDISKAENGIVLTGGSSVVKGNYIHDLQDGSSDPHYDGISVQGGQNGVLIEDNTVFARDTSNIFIKNDFGPISDVRVNNNYLAGDPGIMIYVDGRASGGPITGVSITNNYMEKGYYDYFSIDNSSPVISGNVYLKEGQFPSDVGGASTDGTDSGTDSGTSSPDTGTDNGTIDPDAGTGGTTDPSAGTDGGTTDPSAGTDGGTTDLVAGTDAGTSGRFPDASNTGVPDGVTLTPSGSIVVTKAGTVLKNLDIKGDIYVMAPNVTIENCRITTSSWQGINTNGSASGLVVQNCEINGQGKMAGSYGIMGHGTFIGNNIYGFENGIGLSGGSGGIVKGNFIHDLQAPGSDPHYDGIAIQGGQSNVLVEGNTVFARDTSNIFIKNDFGPISDVRVNNNYLAGDPGIMIYVDGRASGGPITGVSITNNYMEKGYYDYFSIDNSSPVISGNVYLKEGQSPYDVGGGSTGGETTTPEVPGTGGDTTTPEVPETGGGTGETVKTITGTAGNDSLPASGVSNGGNEKFYGLAGDDVLEGGAGADYLDGGEGSDTVSYASSNAGVTVNLKTGKGYGGHAEGDTIVSAGLVVGSSYADKLLGNDNLNILDGGKGADTLTGYQGDDTYIVDNAGDVVVEAAGGGMDTVRSSVSFTLGANVEKLVLTGSANISGTGNSLANVVHGNSGANTLNGGAGNDTIYGHGGNDTLTGGLGNDAFVFDTALSASSNVDRITDFSVVDDVIHLDNAVFTALSSEGVLSGANFVKNSRGVARDANDHIVYETDTGKLFYDSNGSARGGSVHIATLDANLDLQASDFIVI